LAEESSNTVPRNKSAAEHLGENAGPEALVSADSTKKAGFVPESLPESVNEPPESPADLIAEAAAGVLEAQPKTEQAPAETQPAAEPETPEIERVETASEPGETEGASHAAETRDQEEPPAHAETIEETVLAPEVENEATAAEPDLDVALEAGAQDVQPKDEPASPISPKPQTEAHHPVPQAIKREEGPENSPFSVIVSQVYEGPMDLLLDLIRKQDIDIYNIPIAQITAQFLAYVNHLRASDMDVAGEFIYTASLLIHIKSKMLLPREPSGPEDVQEDPRRELVERLLEHERFKNAAQMLQQKQMLEAATWTNPGVRDFVDDVAAEPEIAADTVDLVRIFREILERARNRPIINLEEDTVTVGQMIQFLSRRLTMEDKPVALRRLLAHTKSERALIAMFLALLELVRLQAILLRQDKQFSEIFIKKSSGFEGVMDHGVVRDDWQ
jgi:segregation and condensation protein A